MVIRIAKYFYFSDENTATGKDKHTITVLDIQNKFIVFSAALQEITAVLPEWGSFYILTKDRNLHNFVEKDLQSKLNVLFKKNLYDISIRFKQLLFRYNLWYREFQIYVSIFYRIAKNQQYDSDSLIDIFRQHADHLYSKGDFDEAMDRYIQTIGKLEPSYVIRKVGIFRIFENIFPFFLHVLIMQLF